MPRKEILPLLNKLLNRIENEDNEGWSSFKHLLRIVKENGFVLRDFQLVERQQANTKFYDWRSALRDTDKSLHEIDKQFLQRQIRSLEARVKLVEDQRDRVLTLHNELIQSMRRPKKR